MDRSSVLFDSQIRHVVDYMVAFQLLRFVLDCIGACCARFEIILEDVLGPESILAPWRRCMFNCAPCSQRVLLDSLDEEKVDLLCVAAIGLEEREQMITKIVAIFLQHPEELSGMVVDQLHLCCL